MAIARTPHRLSVALAAATMLSIGALAARMLLTGSTSYSFLVWNLFLAWLPYLAALAATALAQRDRRGVLPVGVLWLLFWPNAPYIVTDVVHLRRPGVAVSWYDVALIGGFAATGVALGLTSLLLIHRVVADRRGRTAGVLLVAMALPLGALGIYLGRVHRFNSWDAVTDPFGLLHTVAFDLAGPFSDRAMVAVVAAMTACLAVGYGVVWLVARVSGATQLTNRFSSPWRGSRLRRRR